MQPNAYWETFLEAVPSRQRCPCSLCMNSTVMEMLVQIQDIWHGGCLQTSWLEANFYPLLKIKSRHVSVILLFDFMCIVCIFHQPEGRNTEVFLFPVQTDRQTVWEGSEGNRGCGRWVYQTGGPVCREMGYPSSKAPGMFYLWQHNRHFRKPQTWYPRLRRLPVWEEEENFCVLALWSTINNKYVGSLEKIIQPPNWK